MRIVAVLLGSAILGGCASTVFSSASLRDPSADAVGISYNLPRAVIGVRVHADAANAQIVLCVREAIAVADPEQQYFMQLQNSPFSADEITVKRNELLGTLQEIDIKAYDQFDQFVINLASSAGAISGARAQNAITNLCTQRSEDTTYELGDMEFDPVKPDQVDRTVHLLNAAVITFIEERIRDCRSAKAAKAFRPHACREYRRMRALYDKGSPIIRMKWDLPRVPKAVASARCELGFCYRHTLPHTLNLSIGDSSAYSHTFQIPNSSPIVSLDLTRAIAVTKTTKISFGRLGEIKQFHVKKGREDGNGAIIDGAEAVELALLPQSVVNAYFTSVKKTTDVIAAMFTSEKDAINNRKALIDAEASLFKARKDAATKPPAMQSSLAESNGFVLAASNAVPMPKALLRRRPEKEPPDTVENSTETGGEIQTK